MNEPIYPDKTKTGLAALKPLTDAFFAEPERWVWELLVDSAEWKPYEFEAAVMLRQARNWQVRLTPKPRRVWIGDQSYPEPLSSLPSGGVQYFADVTMGQVSKSSEMTHYTMKRATDQGYVFTSEEAAQQCLDAYRKARRIE